MRHILCNYASVELLDWEDHVPVFAPHYVAVFDGELLEVLRLDVAVVLWVWMRKDEWLEIHSLGRAVAKEDVKAHVSCVFSSYDVKSCGFHCYFTFLLIACESFDLEYKDTSRLFNHKYRGFPVIRCMLLITYSGQHLC